MNTHTDADLLARASSEPAAFRQLYDRHAAQIHRFLARSTGDDEAAYDLTAETFASAWLARKRFRDERGGDAGPWLFSIARNALLMSVRREALEWRARERLQVMMPTGSHPPSEPVPAWLDGLEQAVGELPKGQREALRLRIDEDLAYDEVAARLGTTPEAARVRVHRALSTVRRKLTSSIEVTR